MTKSWKTTVSGIIALLLALGNAANNILTGQPVDYTLTISAIITAIGLIAAKDSNVTGGTVKQ